jgi:hypothetical protein
VCISLLRVITSRYCPRGMALTRPRKSRCRCGGACKARLVVGLAREGAATERATHAAAARVGKVVMRRAVGATVALWSWLRRQAAFPRRESNGRIEQPPCWKCPLAQADERSERVHHPPALNVHPAHTLRMTQQLAVSERPSSVMWGWLSGNYASRNRTATCCESSSSWRTRCCQLPRRRCRAPAAMRHSRACSQRTPASTPAPAPSSGRPVHSDQRGTPWLAFWLAIGSPCLGVCTHRDPIGGVGAHPSPSCERARTSSCAHGGGGN